MKAIKLFAILSLFAFSFIAKSQVSITTPNPAYNLPNQWPNGNSWNMISTVYADLINLGAASGNVANAQFTTISPLVSTTGINITGLKATIISDSANAAATLTFAQSGATVLMKRLNGDTIVLPTATIANLGAKFTVILAYSSTSVGHSVTTSGTDVFYGTAWVGSADSTVVFTSTANKQMLMTPTTTGGLRGGRIEFTCIGYGRWSTTAILYGSGALATPFKN